MTTKAETQRSIFSPTLILIAGWLVPGLGHLLVKKPVRALLLFLAIVPLFAAGIAIGGKVYLATTGDPLDMLGFAADIGSPLTYLISLGAGWGQEPVATAVAEYGTKFVAVAGLLNAIAAVDAMSLANGRKAAK